MVQGRILFGAEFHFFIYLFFYPTIRKTLFKCSSISLLYQNLILEHMFYRIGRDDVTAHSNMRPPFSEVKTRPGNGWV